MPSLCLFPLSLPRRSLHESVSQQNKKPWRSTCQLINQVPMALPGKETFTYNQSDVCVSVLQQSSFFFQKKPGFKTSIQKIKASKTFFQWQVISSAFSKADPWPWRFWYVFSSWHLPAPCQLSHFGQHPAQNRDAAPETAQSSADTQFLLSPPPFHS